MRELKCAIMHLIPNIISQHEEQSYEDQHIPVMKNVKVGIEMKLSSPMVWKGARAGLE